MFVCAVFVIDFSNDSVFILASFLYLKIQENVVEQCRNEVLLQSVNGKSCVSKKGKQCLNEMETLSQSLIKTKKLVSMIYSSVSQSILFPIDFISITKIFVVIADQIFEHQSCETKHPPKGNDAQQ